MTTRPAHVRVVVVDDHPLFAQGTVEVLDRMPGIRAVGFALGLADAAALISELRPDVVLCDIMLGDEPSGFRLPDLLDPDPGHRPQVIFLSQFSNATLMNHAHAAGAAGYLPKTSEPETLRAAILAVAAGSTVFPRALPGAPTDAPRPPSPRELEVLRLVAAGRSNGEIAAALGIGETTVETHLDRLRSRYGQANRTQLAILADRQGWLSPAERPRT